METEPLLAYRRGIDAPSDPETSTKPQSGEAGSSEYGYIDPVIERRVVRKLDQRIPTLLGFLCKREVDHIRIHVGEHMKLKGN